LDEEKKGPKVGLWRRFLCYIGHHDWRHCEDEDGESNVRRCAHCSRRQAYQGQSMVGGFDGVDGPVEIWWYF